MSVENFDYTTAYREHGNGIYLEKGETFEGVVARDTKVLETHGVTKEQIGQSLKKLFSSYDEFLPRRGIRGPQSPCPEIKMSRQVWDLGQEFCPYLDGVSSSVDWWIKVDGLSNGNKGYHPKDGPTVVSEMLPEMIERLGFFEGTVFYGIKPEWTIAVHNIIKKYELVQYRRIHTKNAWSEHAYFITKWLEDPKNQAIVDMILNAAKNRNLHFDVPQEQVSGLIPGLTAERVYELMPKVKAYVAPGSIAPQGFPRAWETWDTHFRQMQKVFPHDDRRHLLYSVIVPEQDVQIPVDLKLESLPFDVYVGSPEGKFERDHVYVVSLWPYRDFWVR